uniref:Chromatin modification-related protein EAF1 B-like n=1 Tax=Ananas comosus var. bracteatus TaxID=296719 RepID=A0A6V7PCS9_ANACO|nr:unnamed protein product [Ananas comosus var. bracteatus]
MGGIFDCGIGVDTKTSPRRAAIEKAQAELRQEYDVREERRRELEFLEKGGNPLDFKFGHVASLSVQSTSVTDQLAEQNAISEAKGSFALAASPHGDSVESSGRPGSSMGREPNIADNLLLLDGDNSNREQSSQIDGGHNAKESEDSPIFRLGVKSQAYARRNRSRSSRDNVAAGNRFSVIPSSRHDLKVNAEENAVSSISNSKPASPNGNDVTNRELNGEQIGHDVSVSVKEGSSRPATEVKTSEANNEESCGVAEAVNNATASQIVNVIGKEEAISIGLHSIPNECAEEMKDAATVEKISYSKMDLDGNDLGSRSGKPEVTNEAKSVDNREIDPFCTNKAGSIDVNDDGEHPTFGKMPTTMINNISNENGCLINADAPDNSIHEKVGDMEVCDGRTEVQNERQLVFDDCEKTDNGAILKPEEKPEHSTGACSFTKKSDVVHGTLVSARSDVPPAVPSVRNLISTPELQNSGANHLKTAQKEHEDAILRKARTIEANRKRAGELSCNISLDKRQKCHWDFVLEEMAWMANDFMQERLWKNAAAAQLCRWIASSGRAKFEQANLQRKQKTVARFLAKAIVQFWHSSEALWTTSGGPNKLHESSLDMLKGKLIEAKAEKEQDSMYNEVEKSGPVSRLAIHDYAVRFLEYNSTISDCSVLAEAPTTPDRLYDVGILEVSDQLSEESLFYAVTPGAMQAYRESVESQWVHYKKSGNVQHQEDRAMSMCDYGADGARENAYEEDGGEMCAILLPGTCEGTDPSYDSQPLLNGKRPSNSLNVGHIPTKRVRTAIRTRLVSPFTAGPAGSVHVNSKTDVSSGDTNSYQDDRSSLQGGSLLKKNMEVESTVDFERQMPYECVDASTKSKKKKKSKHSGYKTVLNLTDSCVSMVSEKASSHEQRFQIDTLAQHEQKDHMKKRLESQNFEPNGNNVLFGQHTAKKPKLLKQVPDTLQETLTPVSGSMPSPVASQMSNMPNPNKLIKMVANRDRGRKGKALKMAAGPSGCGSPWSNFEDQALVVLVHDMGPNWELVSDAINSTLQFKCIYRKPKECKERHKFLMDRSAGDGADSAEDSGSSQPYPSTLPGIPKGSARQLFQRLQGPLEEDTLKAHFEKIILLGHQLRPCRSQNEGRELKQITPAHTSHVVALSQVCPNNLGGGVLTPLDLCEVINSSQDVFPIGYQGLIQMAQQYQVIKVLWLLFFLHKCELHVTRFSWYGRRQQHAIASCIEDAQRYGLPRPTSLPLDEHQRMQQYGHMFSGRNLQQSSSISVPGAALPVGVDRGGVCTLPAGNGMGMMRGLNRGVPMPRPGFQGISPPAMMNMVSTGNMLPSNGHGMQSSVNVQRNATVAGAGNSMLRPRESLQMLRPGQNLTDQRQMMQELQIQVSQGNVQSYPPFNGISGPFSNPAASSPVQSFPVQPPQPAPPMPQQPHMLGNPNHPHIHGLNHAGSQQQQAYAIHFAKERQIQQGMMAQSSQHPFPVPSGPNGMPPIQNSQQTQPSPVPPVPSSSQASHKQQRNPQASNGTPSQVMKQRQRQQAQPQQQQQQQQPAKTKPARKATISTAG